MAESALDEYLARIDERYHPTVRALDRAVRDAGVGFDVAIKYRMLTYAIGADYWRWVCAVSTTSKLVCLRFLYGVRLDDPAKVFRGAKTSPLRTIDYPTLEDVDPELVTAYVQEAASKFERFKAETPGRFAR